MWVGRWSANADSNFWDDNFQNFKASRGRLGGVLFGGDYIHHVDRHNAFMVSAGGYANSISEPARHVRDESGNPLEHHLNLDTQRQRFRGGTWSPGVTTSAVDLAQGS